MRKVLSSFNFLVGSKLNALYPSELVSFASTVVKFFPPSEGKKR